MPNRARLIAVATVLLVIAFACLTPTKEAPTQFDDDNDETSQTLSLQLKRPARQESTPAIPPSRRNPLRPPAARQLPKLDDSATTTLPGQYQPIITQALTATAAANSLTIKEQPTSESNSSTSTEPKRVDAKPLSVQKEKEPARNSSSHRVRDGDSLQEIATRYLGDESRFLEIYDLNRDILIAPDILPIGLQLKLPTPEKPP